MRISRKARVAFGSVALLAVVGALAAWLSLPRLDTWIVGFHQRSVTRSLAAWGPEAAKITDDASGIHAAEMVGYMSSHYVPGGGYRGPTAVEAALEAQRRASIDLVVASLQRYTGLDYGMNVERWTEWAERQKEQRTSRSRRRMAAQLACALNRSEGKPMPEPRSLTANEAGSVRRVLELAAPPGADALIAQIPELMVAEDGGTWLTFTVPDAPAAAGVGNGVVPGPGWMVVVRGPDGRSTGHVDVFLRDGFVSSVDNSWWTDTPPSEFPPPDRLRLERVSTGGSARQAPRSEHAGPS
jgi:hypothetical protein